MNKINNYHTRNYQMGSWVSLFSSYQTFLKNKIIIPTKDLIKWSKVHRKTQKEQDKAKKFSKQSMSSPNLSLSWENIFFEIFFGFLVSFTVSFYSVAMGVGKNLIGLREQHKPTWFLQIIMSASGIKILRLLKLFF